MTDQLIKVDANAVALRQAIEDQWDAQTTLLTLEQPAEAMLAHTIMIAKRSGGPGAGTLALMLEYLTRTEALIIEIGGNTSPGFKNRSPERHRHFPSRDIDRVNHALDLRLERASSVAILEFEPALFRESIKVAASLKAMAPSSAIPMFYIAGTHEHGSSYKAKASHKGIDEVLMCRQATQRHCHDEEGYLQIPWLDREITANIHGSGLSLKEAIQSCSGQWTKQEARMELADFGNAIFDRLGK